MRLRVFTVYDVKAKAYLPPFFLGEIAQAQRAFSDAVNGDGHQFAKHPEDYTLFLLGDFDDATGKVTTYPAPELVCTALEVKHNVKDSKEPAFGFEERSLETAVRVAGKPPAADGRPA